MVVTSWTDRRACHAGFVNTSINTYKRSLVRADLRTHFSLVTHRFRTKSNKRRTLLVVTRVSPRATSARVLDYVPQPRGRGALRQRLDRQTQGFVENRFQR